LLALVDRQLIIAEAKSNNALGTKKQRNDAARKRVMAAKVLVADEDSSRHDRRSVGETIGGGNEKCHPRTGVTIGPASSPDYDH
jgi:hypothetical protein